MKSIFTILLFFLSFHCFSQQQDTIKTIVKDNTPWAVQPSSGISVLPLGTYSRKSECCGYYSDKLILKKGFQYLRIYSLNNFDQVGSWTISGTWIIKNDNIILIPTTVKQRKGDKCICANQIDSLVQLVRLCNTDTLTFKDNALWTLSGIEYKRRSKK